MALGCIALTNKESKLNALEFFKDKEIINNLRVLPFEKKEDFTKFHASMVRQANDAYGLSLPGLFTQEKYTISNLRHDSKKLPGTRIVPIEEAFEQIDNKRKELGIYHSRESFNSYYDNKYDLFTNDKFYSEPLYQAIRELDIRYSEEEMKIAQSDKFIQKLIEKLVTNLGMDRSDINQITSEEAVELLKETKQKWSGQKGFYYKGKVYLVEGLSDFETVIHEFSHPFIKSIKLNNRLLFDRLVKDFLETPEGKEFFNEALSEYPEGTDLEIIHEELLVKSLTYYGTKKTLEEGAAEPSKGFVAAIKKFLYALKQALRRLTKNKIKDININTSLEELSEMMLDKSWDLNMSVPSREEMVAFMTDYAKLHKGYEQAFQDKKGQLALGHLIEDATNLARTQLNEIKNSKNKKELTATLTRIGNNKTFLESIIGELSPFSDFAVMQRNVNDKLDEVEEFKKRTSAVATNLITLKDSVEGIQNHIDQLKKSPDQQDALAQITPYTDMLKQWDIYLNATLEAIGTNLPSSHPIKIHIDNIKRIISDSQKNIRSVYDNVLGEMAVEMFEPLSKSIIAEADLAIEMYNKRLKKLSNQDGVKAKNIKKRIKKHEEEKKRVATKESMLDYMHGKMGDISVLNAWMENYTSSNDPAVASFALYVKSNLSKAHTKTQAGYNSFAVQMEPLFKSLGLNPSNLNAVEKAFLFKDKTFKIVDGEIIEDEVYTYYNEHKNYKFNLKKISHNIEIAKDKYAEEPSEENLKKYTDLVKAKSEHQFLFFNDIFTDEYNYPSEVLKSTEIGRKALAERNSILSKIEMHQKTHEGQDDLFESYEILDVLWQEYSDLYSLYDNGVLKEDSPSEGIYDLSMAKALRNYRDETNHLHEYKLRKDDFDNAYKFFVMKEKERIVTVDELEEGTKEYEDLLQKRTDAWLNRNTKMKIKDSYYEDVAFIYDKINLILGSQDEDIKKLYESISNSLEGKKDNNGEIAATELTEKHLASITKLEKKILSVKDGLEKRKLPRADKIELKKYFNMLENLQKNEPTSYYLNTLQEYYDKATTKKEGERLTIDSENINLFYAPDSIEPLLEKDEEFKKWFHDNHYLVERNIGFGKKESFYKRSKAWSKVIPVDESYYESTTVFENGKELITIPGLPSIKYYDRKVKDKYFTGYNPTTKTIDLKEGVHIDNKGRLLPKTKVQMEDMKARYPDLFMNQSYAWDEYINHEYLKIKEEGGDRYKALEIIKDFTLDAQKGLENSAKLGLEHPRFRMKRDEYVRSEISKGGKAKVEQLKEAGKQWFQRRSDDQEHGLNYSLEDIIREKNIYVSDKDKIPVRGKYLMEIDQVSKDVIGSLMSYYQSVEENKVLKEMQPTAQAMQELAKDNPIDLNNISKNSLKRYANRILVRGDGNNRKKQIDSIVEIFFEGKNYFEKTNNTFGIKALNTSMGMASHSFFAFDMISAAKNFFGAQYQIALESATGKYYSYKSWQTGRFWALTAQAQISRQIYAKGPKSIHVQLIEMFDAIQGRQDDKFGESMSRSLARDVLNGTWTTSHRKYLENEATLQIFAAIMTDTIVEQNGKKIKYINAWQLNPVTKTLELKEGIDKKWDIDGKEFTRIKFRNQEVSNFLQGAYAKFDQSMINRYMSWKLIGTMKKFFVKMAIHRMGHTGSLWNPQAKLNVATGESHTGYYIKTFQAISHMVRTGTINLNHLPIAEKQALIKSLVEILKIILLKMAFGLVWGYDYDDEQKWAKIRERSGAMPIPYLVDEDYSKDWNFGGWAANNALLLSLKVEQENVFFIPLFGYGLKDMYNTLQPNSIALNGSVLRLLQLGELIVTGDTYAKDTGALTYKQEGEKKYWNIVAKMVGIKGHVLDTGTAIKNYETFKNK